MWTVVCSASEPLPGKTETISTWPTIAAMSTHGARNSSVESRARRPPASGTLATQARKRRPISTPYVIGTRAWSLKRSAPERTRRHAHRAHEYAEQQSPPRPGGDGTDRPHAADRRTPRVLGVRLSIDDF